MPHTLHTLALQHQLFTLVIAGSEPVSDRYRATAPYGFSVLVPLGE